MPRFAEKLYSAGHKPFDFHVERLIALLRFALSAFCIVAVFEGPLTADQNRSAIILLLTTYMTFAMVVAAVPFLSRARTGWQLPIHIVDVGMVSVLMHFLEGISPPFFLLYTFLLLGATVRWNWRGALWTTLALLALDLALSASLGEISIVNVTTSGRTNLLIQSTFLSVVGGMFAYFGACQEANRSRLAELAAWPGFAANEADDTSFRFEAALNHVANILQVSRVLLLWVLSDEPFLYVSLWSNGQLQHDRKPSDAFGAWTASQVEENAFGSTDVSSGKCIFPGGTMKTEGSLISESLRTTFHLTSVVSAPICSASCTGRIFMLDKADWGEDDLIFSEIVAARIAIELEHYALRRQLAEKIATNERVLLARDLHDGVLQGLTAAGLQLKAASVRLSDETKVAIDNVRELLVVEQRRIRSFVEARHTTISGPNLELGRRIRQLGELKSRQWGCDLRVSVTPETTTVAGDLADQIEFILAETVANAVRHGQASRLDVSVKVISHHILLEFRDNGGGLKDAAGVYSSDELAAKNIGPASLRGRISKLGGKLTLRSSSEGVEIWVELPL